MIKLSSYYRLYKFVGPGTLMRILLDTARLMKIRYLVVRFDPNWMCNLRCRMCYFSAEGYHKELIPPMDTELFDKIAADIFPRTRILFLGCGAEPLMSPEITEHINTIGRYHIPHVSIVTNGQRLSEKIVDGMVKNKIDQLVVSMDGFSRKTYESIRTGADFELLLDNLKMLKKIKEERESILPHLRINFTAMKRNYKELEGLVGSSDQLGIKTIRVRPLGEWGGALDYINEVLSNEDYQSFYMDLKEKAKINNVELIYKGIYDSSRSATQNGKRSECMYPWYTIQVRGDAKIRFCPQFEYGTGDLSIQNFSDFLKSKDVKDIKYNLRKNNTKSCMSRCKGNFGGL